MTLNNIKEIKNALRNKIYKEIIIFEDNEFGLTTMKCNGCGQIKFKSDFYTFGNKRLICKSCEKEISKLQYKFI